MFSRTIGRQEKDSSRHAVVKNIIVEVDRHGFLQKRLVMELLEKHSRNPIEHSLGYLVVNKKPSDKTNLDYRIGDIIVIDKKIIDPDHTTLTFLYSPKIVEEKRTGDEKIFESPNKCPACGCDLITPPSTWLYSCTNLYCPGKIKAQIIAFSNSIGMNLDSNIIGELVEKKKVLDPADLFFLKTADLIQLNKEMDKDVAQCFINSIEKGRRPEMTKLYIALLEIGGLSDAGAIELGVRTSMDSNSLDDLFDRAFLSSIIKKHQKKIPITKTRLCDDIDKIFKLINNPKTDKLLKKLNKGGVVFPSKQKERVVLENIPTMDEFKKSIEELVGQQLTEPARAVAEDFYANWSSFNTLLSNNSLSVQVDPLFLSLNLPEYNRYHRWKGLGNLLFILGIVVVWFHWIIGTALLLIGTGLYFWGSHIRFNDAKCFSEALINEAMFSPSEGGYAKLCAHYIARTIQLKSPTNTAHWPQYPSDII